MFLTSDIKVPGLNPAGGENQLITVGRVIAQSLSLSLFHRLDINVERIVKH